MLEFLSIVWVVTQGATYCFLIAYIINRVFNGPENMAELFLLIATVLGIPSLILFFGLAFYSAISG